VSPAAETARSDPLSIVVALSRRLSSLHHPVENLLAYCQAATAVCPRIARIHIAFYARDEAVPRHVFLFGEEPGRLVPLGPRDLTPSEKKLFRGVSKRRLAGARDPAPGTDPMDAFFREPFPGETGGTPVRRSEKRKDRPARGLQAVEPLPLPIGSGPDAWVFFTVTSGGGGLWSEADRNAVSLCTDLLSASLDRAGLFAKVLRAKKEWERSVDAIRDVVMIVAPDHTVIRANRRLAELAGVPVEGLHGRTCHSLLAASDRPCPNCPARDSFRTGAPGTAEIARPRWNAVFQVWTYPLRDASGGPDSLVLYEKDITEFKQMQEKLVQAEKMAVLGELAAAVAHELNNPLSGVISFSKILLQEMDPSLPYVEDLKTIEHAALRCKKIVQDLLVFARKPGVVTHDPVPVRSVVEQVLALMRPGLAERKLRTRCAVPEGLPDLPFHPDLLHQILTNLVANARDASEAGGEIRIEAAERVRAGVPHLVVSVRDQGHGIPPGGKDRIFDPFYTTKGPGEGTGLGLSICRKLMDAFGGAIEVTPAKGRGTAFSLWFPLGR